MDLVRRRLDALAKPVGSLGRLEQLAIWLAGVQGRCPPASLDRVAVVVFAGDHGITQLSHAPVSAYPRELTATMVHAFLTGQAAVSVLAEASGARVRVCDLGVDADLAAVPPDVTAYKVRRGSPPIDRRDALTHSEVQDGLAAGCAIADDEIDAGTDLLIPGDMGIGNTTVAAAVTGAILDRSADEVVGAGTGIDAQTLAVKTATIDRALRRTRPYRADPTGLLRTGGSADLAAMTGFLARSAERETPVLLDGIVSGACALLARQLAPGAQDWWQAGHRSTEPAHRLALAALGLTPILDLQMRLGEASGALTALPVLRTAGRLLAGMPTLDALTQLHPQP